MKKLLLFSILVFLRFISFGQEYNDIFLGNDVNSYKGLYLRYREGTIGEMEYCFYNNKPSKRFETPVYHPEQEYNFNTDTSSIKNRDFLVVNIYDFDDKHYIFELKDTIKNETIWFIYNSEYNFNFPFRVKGFSYNSNAVIKFIDKKIDEFTGEITYQTPIDKDMVLIKVIHKGVLPKYYLSLEANGNTLTYRANGAIILFTDGTKLSKPNEKIDVRYIGGDSWRYSAFIRLTQEDLLILSKKEISKFRLYLYDNFAPDEPNKLMFLTQAIIKLK